MMTNLLHVDGHIRDRRSINSDVFSLGLPMALTKWGVQAFLPCGYLEADKIDPVYSCRAERFVNIDTNFIIFIRFFQGIGDESSNLFGGIKVQFIIETFACQLSVGFS